MRTQSCRDPNLMIGPVNGDFKSSEEMGSKPPIKGNVAFSKQLARKSPAEEQPAAPSIYKYADMATKAIEKFKLPKVPLAGYTMDKALGRDNAMYNISEHSNLKDKEENAFYELMQIQTQDPSRVSSMLRSLGDRSAGLSPQMTSLRQISSMMQGPKWAQHGDKQFEKKKYSLLLNYASTSSINL